MYAIVLRQILRIEVHVGQFGEDVWGREVAAMSQGLDF